MEPLITYLRETRTTTKAFAKIIGVDQARLERMLSGAAGVDPATAQRMVDATGGALLLSDLADDPSTENSVLDLRGRFAAETSEIDQSRLSAILAGVLAALVGGGRRKGDDRLCDLAAEAAANTYAALSTVTSRRGEDRLIQALRPVFSEILEELAVRPAPGALDRAAAEAARCYFRSLQEKRPA